MIRWATTKSRFQQAAPGGGIPETLTITGIMDPLMEYDLVLSYAGLWEGYPRWETDNAKWALFRDDVSGKWSLTRTDGVLVYVAEEVSDAATPIGLVSWTVSVGTGSPVVVAGGVPIPDELTVTGITDPADSDPLILSRISDSEGYPAWNNDNGQWAVGWSLGTWGLSNNNGGFMYIAIKISDETSPVGLTGWDVIDGTGQPTVAGS
jgi:hypothetical protein